MVLLLYSQCNTAPDPLSGLSSLDLLCTTVVVDLTGSGVAGALGIVATQTLAAFAKDYSVIVR